MELISHYLSVGTWYQNIIMYALLAALVYANFVLIKAGEKKRKKVET